ncbi:hypothetical protein OSB04_022591 [Centaurea solstitialis]|uniref:AB hydrolase-1 domain-containing protein n=1 Tax=Centaurea solstitialis TaxID=347529 RepID=A0AA38SWP2_9ASTR|nr:hypothetical protein OSB04_022591 [Centaurea solstitialis]
MEGIHHKSVRVNRLNIHIAEKGEGPLVLFVHGFPELWYSWRHQILYLADHGYRAVAPDLRGYGNTTGALLDDPTKFTIHHLVGDLIGLLDAITNQEEKVFSSIILLKTLTVEWTTIEVYNRRYGLGMKECIHNGGFQRDVPLLEEVVVMEGVAHFINQDKPHETNNHILEFLNKF